jgi:drug/metabolite transporter (DMT)-like permease
MVRLSSWLTDVELWFYLLWTGLVTALVPIAFINYSLATLSSPETALLVSTEQIFATTVAVIFFGERLSWELFVGGICVLAGCVIATA